MTVSQRLRKPAIGLIGVAFFNLLIWLRLFERLVTDQGDWTTEHFVAGWMNLVFLRLPETLHLEALPAAPVLVSLKIGMVLSLITFYGAAHMMAGKRYFLATICSVLVMIPILSPLFVLGIPAGAWALYHLRKPDVVAAMKQPAGTQE